jgi:hypothetical protein
MRSFRAIRESGRWKSPSFAVVAALLACLLVPALAEASLEPVPELDVNPPVILVLPSSWSSEMEPVVLKARISDRSGIRRVTAWVMGEEDEDYRPFRMDRDVDGGYVARLPEWAGRGSALVYFVEAYDLLGNGPRRSAGPGNPFVLRAEAAEPVRIEQAASSQREIAIGLLLAPLALLWLMYRQDRGQRERKFWVGVLEPMTDLRGAILVQAIEGICSRPVFHPYRGEVRLNRTEIRRWMRCLRESGELKPRQRTPREPAPWQKRRTEAGSEGCTIWLPASNSDPTP